MKVADVKDMTDFGQTAFRFTNSHTIYIFKFPNKEETLLIKRCGGICIHVMLKKGSSRPFGCICPEKAERDIKCWGKCGRSIFNNYISISRNIAKFFRYALVEAKAKLMKTCER